ncbi:MAG: hypothetical protein JXA37_11350 [Chloroflexia bacterium]|nr:hypothetical protein [Chloroflexia bacterium]
MSVVLVVKVSEGLVLAADSAATLMGKSIGPTGVQEGVLKTFYHAEKLLQIGDFPIGVLTWGNAFVGPRTLESIVREWEHNNHWESRDDFNKEYQNPYQVRECAEGLLQQLRQVHSGEFSGVPKDQQPGIGMIVAGYSEDEFFPEIWRFVVPLDDGIHNQRPDVDGKPAFGASWFGMTEPIVRLHFGRDDGVSKIIAERFDIPEPEVRQALEPLQYPIPFAQMPLQDAIDYAHYMVNVVIGRYRFVIGAEFCGGAIDIAVITPREFGWISRKSWKLD